VTGEGLLQVEPAEDAVQRRADVRVQAVRPLRVAAPGAETVVHTLDVSGGGLLVTGGHGLGIGDRLSFSLDLGEEHPTVNGEGVVVRATDAGHVAVRIDVIDPRERQLLIRFVFERQRLDRKHGRLP
jgi:c-di-GMP-binding flagellar brake protein YcgR